MSTESGQLQLPENAPLLPIHDMEQRHPGLTKAIAYSYTEAARVCLDRHHRPPTAFDLTDRSGSQSAAALRWQPTDEEARKAWANDPDATEDGAYACVLAAIELARGLVAVRRAETKTGADYYVAAPSASSHDLENCLRLEVSGVDRGPKARVTQRLRNKLSQAEAGRSSLPALALPVPRMSEAGL